MASPPPTFEKALALLRQGHAAAARRAAEAALAADPADARLLHLLGSLSCQQGDLEGGADWVRRALAADPSHAGVRLTLAMALADLGDPKGALRICAEAPPGTASLELRRFEGQLLQAQGRDLEAAAAYAQVLAQRPEDWAVWNNLGNARRAAGDISGAVEALERAAAIRPDVAPLQANLAAALAAAGQAEAALEAFHAALRLDPGAHTVRADAARLLRHHGRFEEALGIAGEGAAAPEVQLERGRALAALHRLGEAEQAYRSALDARPDLPETWLELGILLERAGRVGELPPLLEAARNSGVPEESLALIEALRLQREGRIAEALAAARRAPRELDPVRTQRLIARLADRQGEAGPAFEAAAAANRLGAAEHPEAVAQASAYRAHVAALAAVVDRDWYARWSPPAPPSVRSSPAFLVGFPRSGTTLLDTMLMGHPGAHVLEEVPLLEMVMREVGALDRIADLDGGDVERLRDLYFTALDEAAPGPPGKQVIDKLPLNILGAPLIHRLFPDARFILALRHPCDVALSGFMQGFEMNAAMANFLDLGDTASLYDLVMGYWQRCREILPLNVFELRYESLVADPESALHPLIAFLGLDWHDSLLDHRRTAAARGTISTPSYNQVTQKLYGDASGRWRRYRTQLEPVLPILLPWSERLGYPAED